MSKIQFSEIFDARKVNYIIDNFDTVKELFENNDDDDNSEYHYDPKTILMKYLKNSKKTKDENIRTITVSYKQTNKDIGRHFSVGSLSLQSITRIIRKTISHEFYYDIDIKNCHPVLLLQYCEKNNIDCDRLKKFVKNRDIVYNSMMQIYQLNKCEVKKIFLKILNGGSIPKFIKEPKSLEYLYKFSNNIRNIQTYILENEKNYYEIALKKKQEKKNNKWNNILGSTMNLMLCDIENTILQNAISYMKDTYKIDGSAFITMVFDGFMITKEFIEKNNINKDELLRNLEKHILEKTNYNISLEYKDMNDELIDIPDDYKIKSNKKVKEVIEDDDNEDEYLRIKEEFEKKCFKINSPVSFGILNYDNQLEIIDRRQLSIRFENINYTIIEKGKEKKVNFINEWCSDPNIRTYEKVDFRPKMTTPDYIYNTFSGFEIEKCNKEKVLLDIKESLIYKHLYEILCNNKEDVFNYICMLLSRKLKNPSKLTNVAPIFKSAQGTGKDLFFNWFQNNIIGNQYSLNVVKTDRICGNNNKLLDKKILVILNETSFNDTKNNIESIKEFITASHNAINPKGKDEYIITNCTQYIFLTNNDFPIQIQAGERRFMIIECNNDKANDMTYLGPLIEEIESCKYDYTFYNYLMNLESDDFNFTKNRIESESYKDVLHLTISPIVYFIKDLVFSKKYKNEDNIKIQSKELFEKFNNYVEKNKFKIELNITRFGLDIKKINGIEKVKSTNIYYSIDKQKLKNELINKYKLDIVEDDDIDFKDDEKTNNYDLDD